MMELPEDGSAALFDGPMDGKYLMLAHLPEVLEFRKISEAAIRVYSYQRVAEGDYVFTGEAPDETQSLSRGLYDGLGSRGSLDPRVRRSVLPGDDIEALRMAMIFSIAAVAMVFLAMFMAFEEAERRFVQQYCEHKDYHMAPAQRGLIRRRLIMVCCECEVEMVYGPMKET